MFICSPHITFKDSSDFSLLVIGYKVQIQINQIYIERISTYLYLAPKCPCEVFFTAVVGNLINCYLSSLLIFSGNMSTLKLLLLEYE